MRSMLLLATGTLIGLGAHAQAPSADQDHKAHHPAGTGASAPGARPGATGAASPQTPPRTAAAASGPSTPQMQETMKMMREMHDKMAAAKTPEERQALMADHMKAMHEGMAMMGRMKEGQDAKGGMGMGGMAQGLDAMGKRMDMMEMMMQMMLDREAARAPAK